MSPRSRLRISLVLIFVLLNAASFPAALGQGSGQTPAPPQQRDEVLRINTELVQTDVLVLDKSGKAVPGLTRDQFELLVDGQPVPIQFFESVEAGGSREASKIAAARGGSAASAAGARLLAEMGRTFVFYIDDLHLSQSSVQRTRDLLNKFIDGLATGDQMLIISPSGQVGFLQQLTDNKAVLKMAASRIVYQSQTAASSGRRAMSVFEARAIDRGQKDVIDYKTKEFMDDMGVERAQKDVSENAQFPGAPPPNSDPAIGTGTGAGGTTGGGRTRTQSAGEARANPTNMGTNSADYGGGTNMSSRRFTAEQAVRAEARRILMHANSVNSALLASLESLARGSGSVPGRKLIFFISDGFVLDTKSNDTAERLRRVIDAAARAGAVLYTLDSKGLSVDFADAGKDAFSDIADLSGGANPSVDVTSLAIQESSAAKEILRTLAADTGGRAILNRNDLEGGIGQVVRETGAYYLLAWRPQEAATGQPKFKTIKVSVKGRPELRVLSRGGFYTQPPPPLADDAKTAASTSGPAATKAAEAELRTAVTAPFPRAQLAVAAYTAVVNDGGSYKATGLADLAGYQAADGKGDVDFVAVVLDSSGKSVSSVAQNVKPPSDEGGAKPFRITAKMPNALAPGLYQMRIAARDARTGRVGSVFQWLEIPEFKPGKMTLSSMFLTEESAQGGGGAALEVERRFARASNLLLQFYVYNAARSAAGQPDVTVALNILQGGKMVVGAPAAPLPAAGDPARIQYSVSFPLGEFPPGSYALQVVVEDRVAKKAATQQVGFTVE